MTSDLPRGTVTFLFTDIEASTKLLQQLGGAAYATALAEHRRIMREAFTAHGGVEVDTQGDAFFVAFPTAQGALETAAQVIKRLAPGPIRVRVGIHTGTPLVTDEGYVGEDVHRAARIAASGHGGQALVSAPTAALLAPEHLRDLGEHRLKDLSAPERIYQLGDEKFPPLKSLYRTNLPVPATPFVGRDRELGEVIALLTTKDGRLLTLTGPGGTGKTRLALQAAAGAAESFPDGIWWVPLASLREASQFLPAVAQALGVLEEPDISLAETLTRAIGAKDALLVLDNAEHLLPGAAGDIAALRATAGPVLLVTSRERLQLDGEQLFPVPPLRESESVELFLGRARALDPLFKSDAAVVELCACLENLPLALELAAARTPVFTPEQLLERISRRLDLFRAGREADPRQRTLRATIEWSFDLLNAGERNLFRCLSVFVGGCTFDAAENVCGADPDTLQSLIDKSLIRRRDTEAGRRYWMLETIREYAAERLEKEHQATELRRRHAEWVATMAAEIGEAQGPAVAPQELERVDSEYGNVAAALGFAASRDPELTARIAAPLQRWWTTRGRHRELELWVEPLLETDLTPLSRANVLSALITIELNRLDPERLQVHGEELLHLSRAIAADALTCRALIALGSAAFLTAEVDRGRALYLDAIDLARTAIPAFVPSFLGNLGWALRGAGEFAEAHAFLDEALELGRHQGGPNRLALILAQRANLALDEEEFADALALYHEALTLCRDFGLRQRVPICLSGISAALERVGRRADSVRVGAAATRVAEELTLWSLANEDEESSKLRDALGEKRYEALTAEGRSLSDEDAIDLALSLAETGGNQTREAYR